MRLRDFRAADVEGVESVCAIGAVLQEAFFRFFGYIAFGEGTDLVVHSRLQALLGRLHGCQQVVACVGLVLKRWEKRRW